MADYPNCEPLGTDAAELQAFAAYLRLVARVVDDGHSRECAQLVVAENRECSCKEPQR